MHADVPGALHRRRRHLGGADVLRRLSSHKTEKKVLHAFSRVRVCGELRVPVRGVLDVDERPGTQRVLRPGTVSAVRFL